MMLSRPFSKQKVGFVASVIFVGVSLGGLRYLDQSVAQAGFWFFMGLTLTTGFFHGALDIVLLQREFTKTHCLGMALTLYAGSAALLAIACARSGWFLVLVLLLMSVWHFGEPYGRWATGKSKRCAWIQRAIAGGAPVMLPALLSTNALKAVLPAAVGADAALAFVIWQGLAWLWVVVCGLGLTMFRHRLYNNLLFAELTFVFVINLLLSPLMAFSIYFGFFHATAHIVRVIGKYRRGAPFDERNRTYRVLIQPISLAVGITVVAAVVILLTVIWHAGGVELSAGSNGRLLNAILVVLTAVTLPHLVLISRNAVWLTKQSSAPPFLRS
jgi:Brp/Blh family beta-carotene 15,15'-monooxygenase